VSSRTPATERPAGVPPPRTARSTRNCSPTGPSRSGCARTGRSPGPSRRRRRDPGRPRTSPVVHAPTPSDEPLGRARPAHRLAPARHHPPARRPRPADRLRGGARGGRVRRTPRRLAAGDHRHHRPRARLAGQGRAGRHPAPGDPATAAAYRLPAARRRADRRRGRRRRGLRPRRRYGPATPRSSRARAPTPCRSSPRCCPPCCPPGSNGAWNCGRWASPASRSPTRSTGWPGWRRTPAGGGGSTTASRASTRTGSPGCPSRSPTGVRRSGPGRSSCPPPTPPRSRPEVLARLGLKVAHPDAAHPLLEKLGALPATPARSSPPPGTGRRRRLPRRRGRRRMGRTRPGRRGVGRHGARARAGRGPRTR
jgi:hypothetical protein